MKACVYIPNGFSNNSKNQFIHEFKKVCADSFDIAENDTAVFIHEIRREDCCEQAKESLFVLFYADENRTPDQYDKVGKGLEQSVSNSFPKLKSSIVYREHHKGNAALNGVLLKNL